MPHTWTVAQELHFSLMYSLLLVLLLNKLKLSPKSLFVVLVSLALALLGVQAVLVYAAVPRVSFPVQVLSLDFFYDDCPEPVQNYFHDIYFVTHMRLVPYLLGAVVAVLLRMESSWTTLRFSTAKFAAMFILLTLPLSAKFMGPSVLYVTSLSTL